MRIALNIKILAIKVTVGNGGQGPKSDIFVNVSKKSKNVLASKRDG